MYDKQRLARHIEALRVNIGSNLAQLVAPRSEKFPALSLRKTLQLLYTGLVERHTGVVQLVERHTGVVHP